MPLDHKRKSRSLSKVSMRFSADGPSKVNQMVKSMSLTVFDREQGHSASRSASSGEELYESDNELSVKSQTPSISASPSLPSQTLDEKKLADPFNPLTDTLSHDSPSVDVSVVVMPSTDLSIEHNLHNILHGAWRRTCKCTCC